MVRSGSTSSMGPKSPTSNCTMDKDSPEMDVLSTAIIETIRRIRSQKQRPSLERISKWVLNRTAARDCSFEDVVSRLEDLSSCGKILKVFNQGEYSYRDPETMTPRACGRASKSWKEAKHRHTPLSTPNPHKSPLSSPTSPKIASPELTLIPRNPLMRHRTLQVLDYIKLVQVSLEGLSQPEGATIKDMDRYLETTYFIQGISAIEFSRHLRLACKRLVNAGRLIKDGMIFRLAPNALPVSPEANKVTLASAKEDGNPSEAGSDPMRVCSYCRGTAQCNKDGVTEPLLSCIDCGHSGHPTCMKLSSELAAKVRNLQWQCIECKSCKVCSSKGNADNLLFCDSCDRGFHMECCTPPLSKMPKGSFVCELCRDESVRKKKQKSSFEIGKTPSRGPGRPPNAQRRLLNSYSATNGQSHTPLSSPTETDEKPHEILSESGQHLLQIPFNKKPKGLIDGMTRFFTPSMGGRKTMTSQARTTQLMIMQRTSLASSSADELGAREDDPAVGKDASADHKSCKANITELDENMFFRAREESLHRTGVVEGEHPDPSTVRCPESIEFGKYSIETWYSSPYPQEYARLKKLYLCEFCLKYMKSHAILQRHAKKCQWFHPPANEIYRSNELSVFEVDGNVSKIYCQNLCLLAKLFLDHKTLYYDVEPFSFYCLTINDAKGCHLVGYFSKEKHCQQKYNVSCIMTMPQYQRQGYGRFLIDFSYLLSRKEGQAGSPEKPLSDLGQVSYNAYWRSALLEYLSKKTDEKHLSLRDISKSTGICPHDIASTLQKLGMIKVKAPNDESGVAQCRFNLARKRRVVAEYVQKRQAQANDPTRPPRPTLDPDCLRWTPLVASTSFLSDESGLRSPSTTPEKRLPLSPTSRLNFSPASRQPPPPPPPPLPPPTTSQTSEDQPPTSESRSQQQQEDQGTSSDIENVDVGPSPQAAHTPPKHETPPRHDVTARDVTSPSNADIAKGFIPSPIQRKRGRPRKKPLAVAGEGPTGPFAPGPAPRVPAASSGILRSPGRKKRRRKVKGYPWGKVMKKKKKVVDHKEVSDTDMTTGGNGWRLGGPHFSSDSEDEATKEDKTRSEAPSTADAHCSSEVTAQLPEPADIDAEGPLKSHQPDPHPAQLQLAQNVRKRRRRKSKGYQWGAIKRKIKKPLSGALRRVAMGAVVKRNGPGRPKKIVPPPVEPLPAEEERQAADGTPKQPVQTTIHQFFQRKGGVGLTASTNNNNVVSDGSKTLSGDGKALYSALNESKHVVVASVTLTPPKRAPTPGSAELKRKSKKTPFTPPEAEPKQRRKCAIAGENFVASCLLSTRALKKSGVLGTSNEKKRPRGRPRVNFPPQPTPAPEAPRDPKAEDAEQGPSFLGHGPHMQTGEAVRSSLKSSEGTVAFAKLWIPNLGSGASTFSNMSFKAASAHAYKRTSKRFDLQSPSLTTYREMSRAEDDDEDNDNSSSSSSDAESSSCSSAESSDDNSTDEEPMDSRDEEAAHFDKQWREKSRKMLKRKHHEMRQEKSETRAKEQEKANVGALQRRGASKVEGVKRGRGRPRKYPPKEVATPKMKAKKKMRKMEELEMTTAQPEKKPPGLKLTVHRTSGVYHTSHSEDREEGEVEAPIAAEKTLFEEEKIPEEVFTHTDVLQNEEEDAGEPNPPTQFPSPIPEQALSPTNPHHQSSSDSESESSGSEGDSATLRAKEEALRRHGDPTLPTWTSRGVSSSCASTNDAWPDAGSKSPEPRRSPGSINSPGLDDASMGAVFASVADVRPSSAMSDASHAKDEPEDGEPGYAEGNFGDEGDDDESVVGGNSPMTREESPPPATSRPSSTSEEEKEISAAVASITQADAESPMDHQTYQQQNDFALPPQPQKGSPNTDETTKLAPHEDSASGSPDTHNPALNSDLEIEPSPQCPVLEQTPVVSHHDSADRVADSAHNESSSVYAADAQQPNSDLRAFPPQGCDAAVEEHSAAMACPIPAPAQFNAAQEPQRDPRDFPQACGVEVAAYDGTPMGEIQGGFVAQVRDMSAPEQCQYGSGYPEGGEYAEPMPQGGFQQREMGGSFGSDIYQRPQPQQQQQHAYNANNNPYTETRMFNSSCMADNATPTRLDVIDEGAPPPMMTSPKAGYQQPPPPATTGLSQPPAPMAAPCQPVNPIPAQVAHAHGFQGAPNGPGGSGSTSGYETLSNNSCSPYTSPESANPGSCDHTISTTASAQHIEGTYAPAQTSLTGGVSMSVAVQPHPSAPPGVMYSAPSNDSGHGSEYLASPPSHGMSSCQGTPPKPGMTSQSQQQQTMLSPEPYQQARQQQLNSAGSYTNLPSPSLNQAAQNRPSCAVASDSGPIHGPQGVQLMPCMVQQQQRSPAVVKTPTTPQCAFPHAEEAFTSDGGRPQVAPSQELSPSPSRSNPNALVKLQKPTRDISSHSTSDASTYSTRTTSSAQHAPADAFTPPQIALRRPRYPSTGHPERPASVQPQVVTPMDPCPPPSTPPASLADAPHYAGNPAPGSYGYAPTRSWDPRSGPVARQHPTNAYPGAYEQPYGGGFGGYPGYAATSAPCQFDTQYPNPQTHKLNPGPTYQHNPMLMQPGRQGGFHGPRQADAYGHHGAYGSLAFPPHDARSNLHPTYPAAPPYGGYPPQGQGCYGPNSFPYR